MNCIPCIFCDDKGVKYSYGEDKNYVVEDFPEFKNGLERLLTPMVNFRLFSGFKSEIN